MPDIAYNASREIDTAKIEQGVTLILEALGQDITREGLKGTPHRVASAYNEIFKGVNYTNDEIADMLNVCFEEGFDTKKQRPMVVEQNIDLFSMCEHHLLPMYEMVAHVGYIPVNKVIGLSKIPRIVELVAARPTLQERLGDDIAYILSKITESDDVIVVIEGKHACVAMRGIKSRSMVTTTATIRGKFESPEIRSEFYDIIKRGGK